MPKVRGYYDRNVPIPDEGRMVSQRVGGTEDPTFRSSHFDQPNILAHIRFNDRVDANGKKVLFIEELQSDWAQQEKKQGFKATPAEEEAIKAEYAAAAEQGKEALRNRTPKETEAAKIRMAAAREAWNARIHDAATPAGPFVGKTEAWVLLALKRIIRHAAENGYDKVALTNGEQQGARYDLSKQVDAVRLNHLGDLAIQKKGERAWNTVGTRVDEAKLTDHIGKDAAEKLVGAPRDGAGTRVISGLDLKVGGEGMKAFYDKIVPNIANDVLKKLGGGRVGEVTMEKPHLESGDKFTMGSFDPDKATITQRGSDAFLILVKNPNGIAQTRGGVCASRDLAQAYIDSMTPKQSMQQPGFDITDKLRESVLGGVPLFNRDHLGRFSSADMDAPQHGLALDRETAAAHVDAVTRDWANKPDAVVVYWFEHLPPQSGETRSLKPRSRKMLKRRFIKARSNLSWMLILRSPMTVTRKVASARTGWEKGAVHQSFRRQQLDESIALSSTEWWK